MIYISLVDTNTESETSGTDLWSPTTPESSGLTSTSSVFDFNISNSQSSSDSDNNPNSSFIENFLINEKYLIFGDKLGKEKNSYCLLLSSVIR